MGEDKRLIRADPAFNQHCRGQEHAGGDDTLLRWGIGLGIGSAQHDFDPIGTVTVNGIPGTMFQIEFHKTTLS
jgi:hypothetical protein